MLALLLVGVGAVGVLRDRSMVTAAEDACAPSGDECGPPVVVDVRVSTPRPPTVAAADFCRDVGYLCDGLSETESIRLHRWTGVRGAVVVHVPLPDVEDPGVARELQRAAAQGIRAWNGQPYPILADLRGDQDPHFAVQWTRSLGSNQLGVARTRWSAATGLEPLSVDLATRSPFAPGRPADPRQVRLTAAHEMGHALGLPHSASPHDVMYPTNTATSMSAQDYRSIEVLYRTLDGTVVTR
jgi:hypothetical protein